MSTTDPDSRITYANPAFVQVSGFDRAELIGQPHNIVRHPDMPAAAYADMWATIKAGDSWTALVKNRRKDGDHYWVRANATAMQRDGRVVGYISVRTPPTAAEAAAAEALYQRMRDGELAGWRLHKGVLIRTGALAWLSLFKRISVRWRLRLSALVAALLPAAASLAVGTGGLALAAVVAAALVGALLAILMLEQQIASPLAAILTQAKRVASGQPGENVHLNRIDEIGMLMRAINQAGLNLRALVDDVSEQVGGVADASQEIAHGNQDLSARTEQQASSLQQTAASMEQLTATIKQNADNARQANLLATQSCTVAARGGDVVGQVVTTMTDITASSRRISEIIGVIDGIAFQTNILALNAAVEAARAGEQGRGFAVVAGEVRNLAQRSAQAAREIKHLIADSVDKVAAGSHMVNEAGVTMQEIVAQVRRVTDLISEITAATVEQSGGLGQVNQAVTSLDQVTQQNAALVEQTAAAAEGLSDQARHLADAVAVFQLRRPLRVAA